MVSTDSFDCRSYDLQTYADGIHKKRLERFSTVYACAFVSSAPAAGDATASSLALAPSDLLLTASSTGHLKLFRLVEMVGRWTAAGQQSAEPCCSWAAHGGAVYCLAAARTTAGDDTLLFSGGDDGYVRGWRLSDVLKGLQQRELKQQQQQQQAPGGGDGRGPGVEAVLEVRPFLAVRLPRAESPLGAISLPPAVQSLALSDPLGVGSAPATLFAGCSDGGVHSLDLTSGALSSPQRAEGGCHVAGVLAMDHSWSAGSLATGSEDGTVRLWDARIGGARACTSTFDTGAAGRSVPGSGAEALRCLRNPPTTCLRFEASGSWLLCGHGAGAGAGSLSMWSLGMGQRVQQVATTAVPQAMVVAPSEVLVVGSEAALCRYSAALEGPAVKQPLPDCRSAFGLDLHPRTGHVAVGGAGGAVELLSRYGKKTGGCFFTSDED
ncbi:hypothetical protein HYH02_006965 [Chlamydomonas schloesseri]|uniref:Uncharacterized protein n=1 Tax=Chlamydomonas schloesseri TaxID=2026947 RepID=A0A835WJD6_9CHLO|nr:hypothetical protein HYH02_006965 [Chlamydomonas schloesseri]|eukprot:KAG2448383.1 hypothetical protein HYH02_006965 [Chlamydomonas schloesseri]